MLRIEPRDIIALDVERFRLGGNDGAGLFVNFDMRAGALSWGFRRGRVLSLQFLQPFPDPSVCRRPAFISLLVRDGGEEEFDLLRVRQAHKAAVVPVDPDLPFVFAREGLLKKLPIFLRPFGHAIWPQRLRGERMRRLA